MSNIIENELTVINPQAEVSLTVPEETVKDKFLAILQKNAQNGLTQRQIETNNSLLKANLISSMSEIKAEVFTPALLEDYSRTLERLKEIDSQIKDNESNLSEIVNQIVNASSVEELDLLKAKKEYFKDEISNLKKERENSQEYWLKIHDQFDFKGLFKDNKKSFDKGGDDFMGMIGAIAGVSAGVSASLTANTIENNKTRKRRNNNIPDELSKLYNT